jgi:hypothetical protein
MGFVGQLWVVVVIVVVVVVVVVAVGGMIGSERFNDGARDDVDIELPREDLVAGQVGC